MPRKKLTLWTIRYGSGEKRQYLISVAAAHRSAAHELLEELGFDIRIPDAIRPTTMVPGHGHFPKRVEYEWRWPSTETPD